VTDVSRLRSTPRHSREIFLNTIFFLRAYRLNSRDTPVVGLIPNSSNFSVSCARRSSIDYYSKSNVNRVLYGAESRSRGRTQSIISPRPEQIGRHPTRARLHVRGTSRPRTSFLLAGTHIKNN